MIGSHRRSRGWHHPRTPPVIINQIPWQHDETILTEQTGVFANRKDLKESKLKVTIYHTHIIFGIKFFEFSIKRTANLTPQNVPRKSSPSTHCPPVTSGSPCNCSPGSVHLSNDTASWYYPSPPERQPWIRKGSKRWLLVERTTKMTVHQLRW